MKKNTVNVNKAINNNMAQRSYADRHVAEQYLEQKARDEWQYQQFIQQQEALAIEVQRQQQETWRQQREAQAAVEMLRQQEMFRQQQLQRLIQFQYNNVRTNPQQGLYQVPSSGGYYDACGSFVSYKQSPYMGLSIR